MDRPTNPTRPDRETRAPRLPVTAFVSLAVTLLTASSALAHPEIDLQIADVTALIEENPTDASLLMRRGELHRIHREWDLAAADFAHAFRLDPELHQVHLSSGRMELDAGRNSRAVRAFDRYLKQHPDDARAHGLRGRALDRMGKHVAAARSFDAALAVDDTVAEYYLERAKALQAAGKAHWARALEGLDHGLARLGKAPTLELLAIEIELARGATDGALRRIERVLEVANRKDPWLFRKAEILEAAGRVAEARGVYEDVLRRIEGLPASRRGSRASRELAANAQAALDRLPSVPGVGTGSGDGS